MMNKASSSNGRNQHGVLRASGTQQGHLVRPQECSHTRCRSANTIAMIPFLVTVRTSTQTELIKNAIFGQYQGRPPDLNSLQAA